MQAKDQENQDKVTKLKNEVANIHMCHICIDQSVCQGEEGARGQAQG